MATAGRLLVIDFDGVIADGMDECAMVTWYADRPPAGPLDGPALLAAMPTDFRARFARLRNYARRLDHFAVALEPDSEAIRSQAEFDRRFAQLPIGRAGQFDRAATAMRTGLRQQQREFWCTSHQIFPGIPELLARYSGRIHVLTAKDAASTREILAWHRLDHHVVRIWGESRDKAATVRQLLDDQDAAESNGILFLDDNLPNVCSVAGTGAEAVWARWGWHTAEHEEQAGRQAIRSLRLADLDELTA